MSVKVIASGVGGITESDVTLAAASSARIIGFNVRADGAAARAPMKDSGVEVHYYSIIYEAIDDVKQAMTGMLKPEIKEQIVGLAEVREVFRSSKFGTVAGCLVIEGVIKRGNPVRVLRDNVVIHQGELDSLRRFKDDVGEVRAGTECGIGVRQLQRHPRGRPDRVLLPVRGRAQRVKQRCHGKSRVRRVSPSRCSARSREMLAARGARPAPEAVDHHARQGVAGPLARVGHVHVALRRCARRPEQLRSSTRRRAYLRGPLGRALRLRLAPQLHFQPDEELERGNRLDDLITQTRVARRIERRGIPMTRMRSDRRRRRRREQRPVSVP